MTPQEREAVRGIVMAVAEAIRDLKEVPEGHLYAHLMDKFSLPTFTSIIDLLITAGKVERRGDHMLIWRG